MNIKTILKSSVATAALFAVAIPVSTAQAADDTLKSGNKNSLTISGQVVRSLFYADDGFNEALFHSGGKVTGSRVRWIASGTLNANVTAGSTIEMNVPISNIQGNLNLTSSTVGQGVDGTESGTNGTWAIRHTYVWVNHKKFGKIKLGNTDGASNGRAEVNFIGISGEDTNGITNGTGIRFINTTTATIPVAGRTIGAAFSNFDGASRDDVLRYDTPTFAGFGVSVAAIAGGLWDVGLGYSGKFGPIAVKAGAGYYERSARNASTNFTASGSIALKHDSGLNLNFAIGKTNFNGAASKPTLQESGTVGVVSGSRDDPHFWYGAIGYNAKIFGVGGTNFGLSIQQTDDLAKNTSEAEAITFSVEQSFSSIGAKIMLQYSNLSLDEKSAGVVQSFDDIDIFTMQTIFAF